MKRNILFGDRLKILRKKRKLTQKELGDIINVSDRVIGYYESNDRFPKDEHTLNIIADYFNVSVDYLLGRTHLPNLYILEGNELPKPLLDAGVEYLQVIKEAKEMGLTPEEIQKVLKFADNFKKSKK
jgi:transcriptional regulator with XRE-family HTH domain